MEGPESEVSPKEEKILTPLERMANARGLGYLADAIGDMAKLEMLTQYAEKYPESQVTMEIIFMFDRIVHEKKVGSKGSDYAVTEEKRSEVLDKKIDQLLEKVKKDEEERRSGVKEVV